MTGYDAIVTARIAELKAQLRGISTELSELSHDIDDDLLHNRIVACSDELDHAITHLPE